MTVLGTANLVCRPRDQLLAAESNVDHVRALQQLRRVLREPAVAFKIDALTFPWRAHTKPPFELVADMVIRLACLRKPAESSQYSNTTKTATSLTDTLDEYFPLDADIMQFFSAFVNYSSRNEEPYWTVGSEFDASLDEPDHDLVFPKTNVFVSLDVALTLMVYWAAVAALWKEICRLHDCLSQCVTHATGSASITNRQKSSAFQKSQISSPNYASRDVLHFPVLGHRKEFFTIARKVCESVSYCTRDEMEEIGPIFAVAPLQMVVNIFRENDGHQREYEWSLRALRNVEKMNLTPI